MAARDRIAALETIAVRIERVGERLTMCRVPLGLLAELRSIQRAVDRLAEDIESEEASKPS